MTDLLPLPIFPEGGLASSVTTTVWVGIAVVVFFNLRFGWVLSGLVVPGYLVPLLVGKPAAALVVVGEAVVTYWLVWFYSEFLSARFGWSNFFGRDRFFALVLVSVLVRIAGDGFVLPALGEWINHAFQAQFDYRNNLHSFGLIIISLIANNFWKTGLRRGVLPLFVTVGITYVLVRYVLMTLTNFNISSLSYVYEDLAASILSSPKAYVILLCTAFLASRMNLLYGWDFSGILVPSLLALQWYQPLKVLASFVEAGMILILAHFVMQLPIFRGMTIEGGRKLLLFFNISYLYKFVLAWIVLWLWPEQKITDLYGFGYLLPTLLATKMHEKGIHARMLRATLQTSLAAVFGATVIGFAASFIPDPWTPTEANVQAPPAAPIPAGQTLLEAVRQERADIQRLRLQQASIQPAAAELDNFRAGLEHLASHLRTRSPGELEEAVWRLDGGGFRLQRLEGRYLVLREKEPRLYRGMYVLDPQAPGALAVEVPATFDERGTADAGAWLFRLMGARTLAIAGSGRRTSQDGSGNVLISLQSPFQVFHEVFGPGQALQVRGYTSESARVGEGSRREASQLDVEVPAAGLWVKRAVPEGLSLVKLKALVGNFDLRWGELPLPNLQRQATPGAFAELQLRPQDVRHLLGRALASQREIQVATAGERQAGYLQNWLLADKTRVAAPGSNLYRKPSIEDLIFFDDQIVTPLLRLAAAHYRDGHWDAAGEEELALIQNLAAVMDYQVVRYRHRADGLEYLVLQEPLDTPPETRRYWGTYVFRPGPSEPFIVQVPRPFFEVNSFEASVALFASLKARALLVGGASPDANQDFSADILKLANKENLFNVVNQALLGEAGPAPLLVLQSRAVSERPDAPLPGSDVILATAGGAQNPDQMSPLGRRLLEVLDRHCLSHMLSTGAQAVAGYEAGAQPQAFYLNATQNKDFAVAWVSPLARASFLQQTEPTPQEAQSMALGLSTVEVEVGEYLARHGNRLAPLPASLRTALAPYFTSQDIVVLHGVLGRHPDLRFERLVDPVSRQGFLAVSNGEGQVLGIANLTARDGSQTVAFQPDAPRASLDRFVEGRAAWLLAGGPP